jgi:CBS domain-containing protein
MRIATLLTAKGAGVATIAPEATVAEAVAALAEHAIGALVVSGDGARIDGIVSERDIVRALQHRGSDLLGESVSSIMSSVVHTATAADDTDALMTLMTERRIRHVPIVDELGQLAGIVSIGDAVKARILELEKDRKELFDYIHAR